MHGDPRLTPEQRALLHEHEEDALGISAISCWQTAKLVEYKRLELPCPVLEWLDQALGYPRVQLLEMTPRVPSRTQPGSARTGPID